MAKPRVLLFLGAALVIAASCFTGFAGCLPTYTFGDGALADGSEDSTSQPDALPPIADAGKDGTTPPSDSPSGSDSAAADASRDSAAVDSAPSQNDGSLTPSTVVAVGSKAFSTGFGYQLHLVFAQNDGRYWLFYVDDTPGVIETLASPDLVTWAAQAPVTLATGYSLDDGDDFSVAYGNLGGTDVVHIVANSVASGRYTAFHIRATIQGGALTAALPVALPDTDSNTSSGSSGGSCPQAGPATIIASDGHVYDVTAWTGHPAESTTCDTNIYLSPGVDTGASWNPGAFSHDGYFVSVPKYAFAHDLVDLPEAGVVLAVWPDEDNSGVTEFDSIDWALSPSFAGGGPGMTGTYPVASDELFAGLGTTASYDDWSMCRLTDTDVHVMRHVTSAAGNSVGAFQEVVYNGSTWQAPASVPAAVSGLTNTGVVLLSDANPADGLLLVTIGIDNSLGVSKRGSTGSWTPIASIPGTAQRQSLGGSGCGNAHPAIFWTEGAATPYTLKRADLSSLLGP
jgi:hypothetical protein